MKKTILAVSLVLGGVVFCAAGIHLGETDDAPGAALLGILVLVGAVALGERAMQAKS